MDIRPQVAVEPRKENMTFEQLAGTLVLANIPFSIEGKNHDAIYIDGVLVLWKGKVFAKPDQITTCFNTDGSTAKPLADVKLKDLQPMIQHYRKFYPVSPVTFEAWDELNVQREKPIPVHTPFKVTKEDYYNDPKLMQDPLLLYCPAKELAYKLDPEDPWDRRLLDAFNSKTRKG